MEWLVRVTQLFVDPRMNGFPILIAVVGVIFAYFGYDLFRSGVQDGGAPLVVKFSDSQGFEMGEGGPGLIFCAFGMGLVVYAIRNFSYLRAHLNEHPESEAEAGGEGRGSG